MRALEGELSVKSRRVEKLMRPLHGGAWGKSPTFFPHGYGRFLAQTDISVPGDLFMDETLAVLKEDRDLRIALRANNPTKSF